MPIKIKADTLEALANWKAGKPLRVIELGHIHRMKEHPGMSAQIDTSEHVYRDQARAYLYCFALIERFSQEPMWNVPFHDFQVICKEVAASVPEMTQEESEAAEGLAWKALIVGWKKALEGHSDATYIELKRPEGEE